MFESGVKMQCRFWTQASSTPATLIIVITVGRMIVKSSSVITTSCRTHHNRRRRVVKVDSADWTWVGSLEAESESGVTFEPFVDEAITIFTVAWITLLPRHIHTLTRPSCARRCYHLTHPHFPNHLFPFSPILTPLKCRYVHIASSFCSNAFGTDLESTFMSKFRSVSGPLDGA